MAGLFGATATTSAPASGLFGAPAASAAAPASGLFGAPTAAPASGLFGAPATTSAAPASGLFGAPAASAAPASNLFGAKPATGTAAPAGSLFGTPTSSAAKPSGLFGATATSTGGGLFGTTAPAASAGGLFGKSTAGPTLGSTGGSIFSSAPTSSATVGLGGTTTGGLGGSASQAATGTRTDKSGVENPRDAILEDGLQQLFNSLKERMKANQTALDTFALESTTEPLKLEEKLVSVRQGIAELKNQMITLDRQVTGIAEKSKVDRSIANQATMRQNHLAKGTKYGLEQSVQYMDSIVDTYEDAIVNHHASLNNVENFIKSRLAALDGKTQSLNVESALQQHCTRFEMLFRRSASKIFENDEKVKRVKADFLSVRRRKYGQHAKDPFKSAASKSVLDNKENLPLLKADQTFPSQTTLMRIGQSVPRTAPVAGPTVGFGANTATGSLFGSAAKPAVAPFSFATGATSTASTAGSLFNKPFGTTTTTTTAPSSLFGPTTSTATTTTASAFPFGNTLNSSVSGTLFGGSASKPFGK